MARRIELPAGSATARRRPADGAAATDEHEHWQALASQIGAEIAAPLTAALERVNTLTSTGRIDRSDLRALRAEIESARQIGMACQQLARLASGRLRQTPERLQLADMLSGVLTHRARETQARGIRLKPELEPAEVIADATLLFSLLNAVLDWALGNAQSQIDFTINVKNWPAHARLACRFVYAPLDAPADRGGTAPPHGLDALCWRLIEQTAWTMGLVIQRQDDFPATTLTLEFPRTVNHLDVMSALEIDEGFAPSGNSQPLAGSHVLVVASRRELRVQIREAVRNMSLILDFVNSTDEAAAFCREGLPHAIVIESFQAGERFAQLRNEIRAEVADFVFIEIIEQGSTFAMSGSNGTPMARVGRDVLASSLPAALMFELARGS